MIGFILRWLLELFLEEGTVQAGLLRAGWQLAEAHRGQQYTECRLGDAMPIDGSPDLNKWHFISYRCHQNRCCMCICSRAICLEFGGKMPQPSRSPTVRDLSRLPKNDKHDPLPPARVSKFPPEVNKMSRLIKLRQASRMWHNLNKVIWNHLTVNFPVSS